MTTAVLQSKIEKDNSKAIETILNSQGEKPERVLKTIDIIKINRLSN